MEFSHAPLDPAQDLTELDSRRLHWNRGRSVRMADGAMWTLPEIDWTLLIFNPNLGDQLARTTDIAASIDPAKLDLTQQTLATAYFHSHVAQLGVTLLQLNYDLHGDQWRRLLAFINLTEMLRMTVAIAEVVHESIRTWMPFQITRGTRGAGNLLQN